MNQELLNLARKLVKELESPDWEWCTVAELMLDLLSRVSRWHMEEDI